MLNTYSLPVTRGVKQRLGVLLVKGEQCAYGDSLVKTIFYLSTCIQPFLAWSESL